MKQVLFIILIAAFTLPACKTAQSISKDPRTSIETAIPAMIKLLETGSYKEFFLTFIEPKTIEMLGGEANISEFAEKWGQGEKKDQLLSALKIAQKVTPVYNSDKTTATFKKEDVNNFKDLVFSKVGEYWYLGN